MRPFETLTPGGQVRRVRPIAEYALRGFGLEDGDLRLVQHEENTVFRVDVPARAARNGGPWVPGRFALRVHAAGYQSAVEIRSELQWLSALAAAGVPVPEPLAAASGDLIIEAVAPGAMGTRVVSTLKWLRGRGMHEWPPTSRYRAIGAALARVHTHAAAWQPPPGFTRLTWDWDGLFGAAVTSAGATAADNWSLVPQPHRSRWRRSAEQFALAAEALGRRPDVFSLIHGDFHHGNLLYGDGEIRPVDFNDCGWGWHLYDYAVALSRKNRMSPRWEAVTAAFWAGYGEHRTIPAPDVLRHLDDFLAARSISVSLWAFGMTRINPDFERHLPYTLEQTRDLLDVIGH